MRYVLQWERMVGLVSLLGPSHFTCKGLHFLSRCIKTATKGTTKVPTYKTVKSSQWKFMIETLFVRSSLFHIGECCITTHRALQSKKVQTINNGECDIRDCIRIILPSDWARLDIQTLQIYIELFENKTQSERIGINIEHAPIVIDSDRSLYLSSSKSIWAQYGKTILPSSYSASLFSRSGKLFEVWSSQRNIYGSRLFNRHAASKAV